MNNILNIIVLITISTFLACNTPQPAVQKAVEPEPMPVNLKHFDHLYKEISINGDSMAIVHIYSEYPDYSYAIEPSEGFTCVDDVARAIVMLSEYYKTDVQKKETLRTIEMLTKFVLHMQNNNGYFNNFLWHDLSINTTYQTTVAELNWWSLRAFWALETAYPLLRKNAGLQNEIDMAVSKLLANIQRDLTTEESVFDTINTLVVPAWLPQKYAADQTAVLILGLLPYYTRTKDAEAKFLIDKLARGIMEMQKGDKTHYPFGAFLSWGNLWHAWGNSQAYALLKAGQQLNNEVYIKSALQEVDHFYPFLLKNGFAEAFWVEQEEDHFVETKRNDFPQIAYGIRPMVWATMEAYHITGKQEYLDLANDLKSWFKGNNIAQTTMYDAKTGRGYDGIISDTTINRNSGAESTIESLMTLLKTD